MKWKENKLWMEMIGEMLGRDGETNRVKIKNKNGYTYKYYDE